MKTLLMESALHELLRLRLIPRKIPPELFLRDVSALLIEGLGPLCSADLVSSEEVLM